MKSGNGLFFRTLAIFIIILFAAFISSSAQEKDQTKDILEQNISIYADDESLSDIVKRICDYLNLDYTYNSKLIEGRKISLNVSNKPVKEVLNQLMKDFYLLFEIQDNILVIRDYVPMEESLSYVKKQKRPFPLPGFIFEDPKKHSVTIDFKSASNLIIIPVVINNSDTLNFILDTGVRHPIITELPYVNELNLNYLHPVSLKGLGNGEELTAYSSINNTIKIPGLVAFDQEINVVISEEFQISHLLGVPVHGLIGFNLFKDYIVQIDYNNLKIKLSRPENYKYRKHKKDIVLPIVFDGEKPFVYTSIVTDKQEEVPVKLLVDTGASDAIWLSANSDDRISLPEKNVDTFLGRGLNGDLFGKKGRIGGIWVGPLVLYEPIVAFPEDELIDNLITTNDRNGTLGAEILRRFKVTVDYPNKRLTLRPTQDVKDEFNYNMSGLEVTNPMPGLPIFTIINVTTDSPAFLAGLRENDQILWVNNTPTKVLTLNDINLLFQSREDKKINLTVLRDGEKLKTTFYLKKIF